MQCGSCILLFSLSKFLLSPYGIQCREGFEAPERRRRHPHHFNARNSHQSFYFLFDRASTNSRLGVMRQQRLTLTGHRSNPSIAIPTSGMLGGHRWLSVLCSVQKRGPSSMTITHRDNSHMGVFLESDENSNDEERGV